ncbi:MAG TPA: thiamine pyrophosphate-dependent enzyme [Candidatus Krumholzibacteria bacterium]|nr:thiamine pyrophosphate-dependent enzyme [Candidatus Krumholzibacteria bacterium]HPD70934.1 thiamine pyrophosphate-dependent enzyme [Candidatus Krumholzibacteria bacterium]HRY39366.1 thiamine pyrophosphate-dependent enzyme [Candidatus Krumholzibacteria bacterium]
MNVSLKQLVQNDDLLSGGHRACAGCTGANILRQVMLTAGHNTVVGGATGCMEVITTIFPYTAWKTSFIHSAFENAAATVSGVETAYRSLRKHGELPPAAAKAERMNFIAFGGDGGTYDIGLQSLSGAMERGHNLLYVCYDNEAYMNTGIQRSSATPFGAHTSTAPAGKVKQGKEQDRKDLTKILVAHNIPYVAQTTPYHWKDLATKVEKALAVDGPAFINVLMPCTVGWGFPPELGVEVAKQAVETNFWPLFEVENGRYIINKKPKDRVPIVEWLKPQARFKHLFKPGNEHILVHAQEWVDRQWAALLRQEEATA